MSLFLNKEEKEINKYCLEGRQLSLVTKPNNCDFYEQNKALLTWKRDAAMRNIMLRLSLTMAIMSAV